MRFFEKLKDGRPPPPQKKKIMSTLVMLFSLLSTLGDAGLGLTPYGPVEYKPVWRSLVQSFTGKFTLCVQGLRSPNFFLGNGSR